MVLHFMKIEWYLSEWVTTNRKCLESYSYKGYSVSWQKSFGGKVLRSVDVYRFISTFEINALKEIDSVSI